MATRRLGLAVGGGIALGALTAFLVRRRARSRRRFQRNSVPMPGEQRRIVVLGAGFAGLPAATELGKQFGDDPSVEVLVVDRHNYHLFTPLLFQVATGAVMPDNVVYSTRVLGRFHGFVFQESQVVGIDLDRKRVLTDETEIPYDYLVAALGSTTNFFGLSEVEEHSLTLKTLGDSIAIRNRITDAFENADMQSDPALRREWLTFVVVGGGATGVELIAAMHGLVHDVLAQDYPFINPQEVQLILCEARDRILTGVHPRLVEITLRRMDDLGIQVRCNTPIQRVHPTEAETAHGEAIPTRTVVWAAGVRANPLWDSVPVERASMGRVVTNQYLQLPGHPEVYVVGDSAFLPEGDGKGIPPNAPAAIQEGETAARNIARAIRRQPLIPFRYRYKGDLLALGRSTAGADILGLQFDGILGWLIWRTYYLTQLAGFKDRLSILVDWIFAFFYRHETARLECGRELETESQIVRRAAGRRA